MPEIAGWSVLFLMFVVLALLVLCAEYQRRIHQLRLENAKLHSEAVMLAALLIVAWRRALEQP